ncbi:MAG: hypothetical protein VX228_03240 [Pseudomonadota bacterium]|nr:hypothetical protein [Pseudomonadota bacterium]
MSNDLENELKSREAGHLQALESNPFDADDLAMFEMFERKGFTPEQCRAFIIAQAQADKTTTE